MSLFKIVEILQGLMGIIGFDNKDRAYDTNVERAGGIPVLMTKAGQSRNNHRCLTEAKEQGREVFKPLSSLAEEDAWKPATWDCSDFPKIHLLHVYLLNLKKVVLIGKF